jgi:hypothetical protein
LFRKVWNQAPAHQNELALSGIPAVPDCGLKRGRSQIEIPVRQDKIERNFAEPVSFGDALLVRATVVSTAHGKRLNHLNEALFSF